jgi:hypothetical protein
MGDTQLPDYRRGLTFEHVWAALMEDREQIKELRESTKEFHESTKELRKSTMELRQSSKEMQKAVKETQKSIGGLSGAVGTMAESLLVPSLKRKFNKLGFSFEVLSPHRKIWNPDGTLYAEIDALLENGKQAMAVETKLTCERKDVDNHLVRMEKIRAYVSKNDDHRPYFGAIASPVFDDDTKRYALKNGFYVIELSGEDAEIIKPEVEKVW